MSSRILTAVLIREGNLYVARCPETETVSQGPTVEEAVANLKEATELYLEEFPQAPSAPSLTTTFIAEFAQYASGLKLGSPTRRKGAVKLLLGAPIS